MKIPRLDREKIIIGTKKRGTRYYRRVVNVVKHHPMKSFFAALGLLLFFIILASVIANAKPKEKPQETATKQVHVYNIGRAPKVTLQAKIEKSNIITIVAQSPGVVQSIFVSEGSSVDRNTQLLDLSTNYQGDNAAFLQQQIAQAQYQNILDTYPEQKEMIARQRDLANQASTNTEQLRDISNRSVNGTQNLINLNNEIVASLQNNLANYTATNSGGINDSNILQTKELESQFQAAATQLDQALQLTQYNASNTNPPALLANTQRDITLKQLDIQEKALNLSKEVSALQVSLAALTASLLHPVSPRPGVVERVYVHEGQLVNPGTPLMVISATEAEVKAIVLVPLQLAGNVSRMEPSVLHLGKTTYSEVPYYVTTEATEGSLYSVLYSIPSEMESDVANASYISVDVPIGFASTGLTIPYVPIDAVYQTQDQAYVYVVKNDKVQSKTVTLGMVYGRFVEVVSGLAGGDQVIIDRTIIAGDTVKQF